MPKGPTGATSVSKDVESHKKDMETLKGRELGDIRAAKDVQERLVTMEPTAENFLKLSTTYLVLGELSDDKAEQLSSLAAAIQNAEAVSRSHPDERSQKLAVFNLDAATELIETIQPAVPQQTATSQAEQLPEKAYVNGLSTYLSLEGNEAIRARVVSQFGNITEVKDSELLDAYKLIFMNWYESVPGKSVLEFGMQDIMNANTSDDLLKLNKTAWHTYMGQRLKSGDFTSVDYKQIFVAEDMHLANLMRFAEGSDERDILYVANIMYYAIGELKRRNMPLPPPPPPPPVSINAQQHAPAATAVPTEQQNMMPPPPPAALEQAPAQKIQNDVPEWSEDNEPSDTGRALGHIMNTTPAGGAQKGQNQNAQGVDQMTLEQVEKEIRDIKNKLPLNPTESDLVANPTDTEKLNALIARRNQLKPQ